MTRSKRNAPRSTPRSDRNRLDKTRPKNPNAVAAKRNSTGIRFAILLALASAGGMAAHFGLQKSEQEPSPSVPSTSSANPAPLPESSVVEQIARMSLLTPEVEAATDAMLMRLDAGWSKFEQQLGQKIETVEDQNKQEGLLIPFKVMESNRSNPEKNGSRLHRQQSEKGAEVARFSMNHFYFAVSDLPEGVAASWSPLHRMMALSRDFDPSNILHLIVLYHELIHVAQDNQVRQSINSPQAFESYRNFHTFKPGERPRMIINPEATAYGRELDATDLYLNGLLSQRYGVKNQPMTVGELATALGISSDDQENLQTVSMILNLAANYFPYGGIQNNALPPHFVKRIGQILIELGCDPYVYLSNGQIGPYRPSN